VGLLDVEGHFQPLPRFVDHMVAEQFLAPVDRDMLLVDTDPERLVERCGR
jgi:predicted Rossmann-fold nucleotide-binding protein